MSEQNKILVHRYIEGVLNLGNLSLVDELFANDYLGHSSTTADETHGPAGARQFFAALRQAFPDLQVTVQDQIAEGDKVATRWTARGTHLGEFRGIPPTGIHGVMTGTTVDRIANGKLVECWMNSDDLGMLQQLGVDSAPGLAG